MTPEEIQILNNKINALTDDLSELRYVVSKKTGSGSNDIQGALMQSTNFIPGSQGWRLTPSGDLEASSGTFRGTITATAGAIGGFTIASGVLTGNGTTGKIQTASSGARVVIDSVNKSLYFYDAVGLVIDIGTDAGRAISITPTSGTGDGVRVISAVAGNGLYYSNSGNVVNRGIFIEQTSTGASNNLPGIEVRQSGSGEAIYLSVLGSGIGMQIAKTSGTGTSNLLKLLDSTATATALVSIQKSHASASGTMMVLENNGVGKGILLTQTLNDVALDISHTATTSANPTFQIVKTAVGPIARFVSSVNNASNNFGIEIDVQNAGAGLEYAFDFQGAEKVNAAVGGTQDYKIRVRIGGTTYFIPCYTA